jgi:hypothetical protein
MEKQCFNESVKCWTNSQTLPRVSKQQFWPRRLFARKTFRIWGETWDNLPEVLRLFVYYFISFLLQLGWHPVAVVQHTFTHEQYTEYRERSIHNNKKKKLGNVGRAPSFASYTLAFLLRLRKRHVKTSVKVVDKCPDIPVAVVQYTFTHTQTVHRIQRTEHTWK